MEKIKRLPGQIWRRPGEKTLEFQILDRIEEVRGKSPEEVSEMFGSCLRNVYRVMTEMNLMCPRKESVLYRILRLEGLEEKTIADIAKEVGVKSKTVRNLACKYKFPYKRILKGFAGGKTDWKELPDVSNVSCEELAKLLGVTVLTVSNAKKRYGFKTREDKQGIQTKGDSCE